ncbi:Uncharacterised protein [Anaerostipes hadrus]|uniref:Uncharacterized protein n=1 Tax=Anaerostipes hadrus TaxID=649756 RepID=A0A174JE36_ANAHA|nr:Uncharacterised protein [Anaerostipes hadrus]
MRKNKRIDYLDMRKKTKNGLSCEQAEDQLSFLALGMAGG